MGAFAGTAVADDLLVAALVLGIALVHLLPGYLPGVPFVSRRSILSAAGGISIVYAFLHLFPELDAHRSSLEGVDLIVATLTADHIYILVFIGIALFYGLERIAALSEAIELPTSLGRFSNQSVFWVHIGGFIVYNAFIGYVLVQGRTGAESSLLFAFAMGFHLFGNDEAMEQHYHELYSDVGQWILAGAVIAGGLGALVYTLSDVAFTILLGFLTGGVIFNAIKDELPRTRESRFWAFALGSIVYALILFAL
ncbi:hypothetical protein C482_03246 [Natrialba chahannaoensis JCM 10990]|uniref:Zinc/iron permease n=1 Tax=Natrialba chahannaoensis JCM 10990 TaxID=1227492 RepID=M0B2I9_9EURY|nr:hypothetical protein [Natrialba chahannaoensis]ELZ04777.1 hypothetical protein C482_03246 [Natrialba chahannaoensis JCM 10990]